MHFCGESTPAHTAGCTALQGYSGQCRHRGTVRHAGQLFQDLSGLRLGKQALEEPAVLPLSPYKSSVKGELWCGWMHTYSDKEE